MESSDLLLFAEYLLMGLQETLRDTYRSFRPNFEHTAFHGDRIYQQLVEALIRFVPISSFLETGTFLGNSCGYVAKRHPSLSVCTSELNPAYLRRAKLRLRRLRNVEYHLMSSEQFVRKQVQEKNDGGIPLFFLDSHWYDYWPLGDEVKAIAESGVRSVTIIDDFQVPDRPEFGYEVGTSNGDQVCGMDMIVPSLSTSRSNLYGFLLPSYSFEDAFPTDRRGSLRGHIVIFQNLMVRFHCFLGLSFVKGYYDRYECFDGMC